MCKIIVFAFYCGKMKYLYLYLQVRVELVIADIGIPAHKLL